MVTAGFLGESTNSDSDCFFGDGKKGLAGHRQAPIQRDPGLPLSFISRRIYWDARESAEL